MVNIKKYLYQHIICCWLIVQNLLQEYVKEGILEARSMNESRITGNITRQLNRKLTNLNVMLHKNNTILFKITYSTFNNEL